MRTRELVKFIVERHAIYERRLGGNAAPWTSDPILQQYRFCNVYRELDRVTQWIATRWRKPFHDFTDLWFALVVARFINHPPTLESLALPGRWNPKQFTQTLAAMKAYGSKIFGSAYIISTNGIATNKVEYLVERVFNPLWDARASLRPAKGMMLAEYQYQLMPFNGMGSFMVAQVIADLKYVKPLAQAPDWWTYASSGPGSRRGLNRVLGLDPHERWNELEWHLTLLDLGKRVAPLLPSRMAPLHAQDLQNCLCEFDKYERTRLGEGRPKQNFTPYGG